MKRLQTLPSADLAVSPSMSPVGAELLAWSLAKAELM